MRGANCTATVGFCLHVCAEGVGFQAHDEEGVTTECCHPVSDSVHGPTSVISMVPSTLFGLIDRAEELASGADGEIRCFANHRTRASEASRTADQRDDGRKHADENGSSHEAAPGSMSPRGCETHGGS